jgi:hypothetical protein
MPSPHCHPPNLAAIAGPWKRHLQPKTLVADDAREEAMAR